MEGESSNGPDVPGMPLESLLNSNNKSVPRGLLYRELGFKQKCGSVSLEFQRAAEDRLVLKYHEELPCELPEVPRSTFLMVFSPDGTKVASTHGNHNIHVTDLNTGKNVNTLSGHPRTPWCIAFHPSSNQILASGCLGGQVRVWDLHGGSEIWTAESQTVIASLAFHPTDRMLVIATYNELHFWDWSQPIPFTKCYTSNQREKVRYVAFDPLGHKLITGISNAPHNQSQWDRVANPSRRDSSLASTSQGSHPRSVMMPADQERRITVCYRSLVEQYEQLVQRYYDLSRSRTPTMDRGTDPMDLSESAQPAPQSGTSGTQSQAVRIHVRGMRFLVRDDSSSSNEGSASRTETSGTPFCSVPSVVLGSVSNMLRRRAQQTAAAFGTVDSASSRDDMEHRTERRDFAHSASTPTRRFEFDNINVEGPGVLQETVEQGFSQEQSSSAHVSAADPARRRRRRSLDGERQIIPDSTTRDVANHPIVTESAPSLERVGLFSRLQSEALPSSPCPPERPHRFFVSQRSAFQPRIPRGDQHARSRSGLTARPPSGTQAARSGYFLHRRLSGAYHSQSFQDDNEESSQGLDSTSDVGVRYGIQLLSRHIDSMQRLCRARLEILQLQQIRRMWEDLQRQIRSLHAAVRDSTFSLTDRQDAPVGPSRRRFRLHAVSGEDSGLGMARQNSQRSGDTEPHATEQGPHIPSVSQMLELARISDIGPPSVSSEPPASTSGASLTREQPVTPAEQDVSSQDSAGRDRLARLHAQFEALTGLKLVMAKRNGAKEEGECSRNIEDGTSRNVSAANGNTVQPVGAAADRVESLDGELSVSQSVKPICFGDHKDTAAEGPSSQPNLAGSAVGIRTSDTDCKSDTKKTENVKNSPGTSCVSGEHNETGSPCKKKRGTVESKSRSANMDLLHGVVGASGSLSAASDHDLCANSSGGTPSVPTITTTTATTATTVTSSSVMNRSNSSVSHESPEVSGHQPSNSWCRYAAASASSAASSQHQRLWRITHRVYMRKPRLLAMGPRSRAITRQPGSNSTSSHRNYAASIFRHHESGGRPWFMQSAPSRSQHTRMPSRDIRTSAQVGTHDSRLANFAAVGAGGSLKEADGDPPPSSSSMSSQVAALGHSSSASDEPSRQSAKKPKLDTSSQSDAQPGPSRQPEEKSASSVHSTSSHERAGVSSATAHGARKRADSHTGLSSDHGNSQQTQQTSATSESLCAMIARLESLVRQQREQRESLHRERRGQQQTNMWELRDRHLWFRAGTNSGSDSDSNPESDRHRPCGQPSAEERLITAIQNETNSSFTFGSHHGRSGALDEDWEWTRESTRLRARQVLSLMVESLTQFFEENGLPNSTSHAVLDEQMYNLYILLQLALELTDLLLAQLVSTRRELEHQWVHRLRSPVALGATTAAGQHQPRRMPFMREVQDTQRSWQAYSRPEHLDVPRLSPYRRLLRYRQHPYIETDMLPELGSVSAPSTRGRSNPRRLGSRAVNCFSRHGSHTGIAAASRICRGGSGRPLVRGATPRRDSVGVRSPSCFRDGGIHARPYARAAEIRSQSSMSRNTGPNLRTSEEPGAEYAAEIRTPNFIAGAGNTVPAAAMPASINQQNNDQQQQQQDAFTVPLVRVNDVPIPDTSILSQPQPQQRPQSPPPRHPSPHLRNPFIQQQSQQGQSPLRYLGDSWRYPVSPGEGSWRSGWRPRFLHPRYVAAPNLFGDDQDEPLIGPFMENINIIRDSFIITDAPMSPNHRLQAWDFSRLSIPDISNADKNVVVAECKIHNDASVDVSNDGRLLVTLLPTGRMGTAMLGVYSLEWESLGQCLYTTSFEQNAVSVSLSPTCHHLLVGLASRRVALLPTDQHTMAQIFRLEGGLPGRTIGARGRLSHIRDIVQDREQGYMSLNCIRWAPGPGQGLVYGTNTGKLKLLR